MNRRILSRMAVVLLVFAMLLPAALPAAAESLYPDFETFTVGSVDGQQGWKMTGSYDVAVVANTYGYTSFGTKSLRISNAVTSTSFGDQTFSKQLANEAGETDAYTATPAGIRQNRFVAEWDFASTVPGAEQPGLSITASPDWGDGSRMSWVQMADTPEGLEVNFYDYQDAEPYGSDANPADGRGEEDDFVFTTLASELARDIAHTIRIEMDLLDGPRNDVVRVYVDRELKHTGTSWEDYFRWMQGPGDPEETAPVRQSRTIRALLFRAGGVAAPPTSAQGFLIDNLETSSVIPGPMASTNEANKAKTPTKWAHVDQTAVSSTSTTLVFTQPRGFYACFEYRTDGDTSQQRYPYNPNPAISDGQYPSVCLYQAGSTASRTLTAREYVEVRMVYGAEGDERFDWTRFDLLPPSLSASTTDALVCGDTAVVTIDLAGVENLYGYEFKVNYDATKANAAGAFVNTFFDTADPALKPWNATCDDGVCKFAVSHTSETTQQAVSGSGPLAQITFTGVAPGTSPVTIGDSILSDIDGTPLPHTLGATPVELTVCGFASASGVVSLQGRATPAGTAPSDPAGSVTLTDGEFGPYTSAIDPVTGAWSISNIKVMPGGTSYTFDAAHSLYLTNRLTQPLMPGDAYVAANTKLLGGNADNSTGAEAPGSDIDITDLTCIANAFGGGPALCNGTGSTDINWDTVTNILDLAITGGNYGKSSPRTWN